MPVSKANQRAVNKYVKTNYDRVNVTMPKGRKDEIKAHAEKQGESVNGFIVRAITEAMEREQGGAPAGRTVEARADAAGTEAVSLPPATLEAAQKAAEATGEAVTAFLSRAVETQAKRDQTSLRCGLNPADTAEGAAE